MVFASLTGVFLLRHSGKGAGAGMDYLHLRSADVSARSGLSAGLAQFASGSNQPVALLNGYLRNPARCWLLGDSSTAGSVTKVTFSGTGQSYSARILGFDPATKTVKIEAIGESRDKSASRVFGIYRLEGMEVSIPPVAKHAFYIAGNARNLDKPVTINGPIYFGGDVHFNSGAHPSVINGTFKTAASASISTSDAGITFNDVAYFQTPLRTQGSNSLTFLARAGFERDVSMDRDILVNGTGLRVYLNSTLSGNRFLNLGGDNVTHSGSANPARITNAGSITNAGGSINIASALGITSGAETDTRVDLSAIPLSKRFTPTNLGIPYNAYASHLNTAYNAAPSTNRHGGFLVIKVSSGLNLVRSGTSSQNVLNGKFVFIITSAMSCNGALFDSGPTSNCLFLVSSGGAINGFGGPGAFRGYVHVEGTGSVIYQWGAGNDVQGAIHHVSALSGFQMNSGSALRLTLNQSVLNELAGTQILISPSGQVAGIPTAYMVDVKVRPQLLGLYY